MGNNPMLCTIHVAKYKPYQNPTGNSNNFAINAGLSRVWPPYIKNDDKKKKWMAFNKPRI
jgi:hypothetical protein